MTRDYKKDREFFVASFFLERLNGYYGSAYSPRINEDENGPDSSVDVFGESEVTSDILRLQLTVYDGHLHQIFADARVEKYKTGSPHSSVHAYGGHIFEPIESVLEKKKDKTTGEEILIIYNDYGTFLWDEEGAKRMLPELAKDTRFKGVFLVIMPSPQPGAQTNHPHEGQVIAIKNIFGEDGVCF